MKGVIFGAGNIGRGFLGLLLAQAGYSVTFVDVDEARVERLNTEQQYPVLVVSEHGVREERVENVAALHTHDVARLTKAVCEADTIFTAVGKQALRNVAQLLAHGLAQRVALKKEALHVVVIACENVQDNTDYLKYLIMQHLSLYDQERLADMISFPNCVVDRIVPNTLPNEAAGRPLAVAVEEYYQLALDGRALKYPFALPGIQISGNLSATLEQKLCTLNMAHAITAYFGYIKRYRFIHEAVDDADIKSLLRGAISEVGTTLVARHASITSTAQQDYAEKVLSRFRNPYLLDEVTRVARDPIRKLGPDDRLIRPARFALAENRFPAYLTSGIAATLHYAHPHDTEAQKLRAAICEYGPAEVLRQISGVEKDSELAQLVTSQYLLRSL